MRALIAQLVRFGLVGAVGLVIDVAFFNLLRVTVLEPSVIHEGPVIAKIASTSLAIIANWIGNRYWTFGREHRPRLVREGGEFVLVSLGGMLIGLACLWVSHYLLGYTSLLADNVSTNVIGLALGTAFRFWLYRVWVFSAERQDSTARAARPAPTARATVPPGMPLLHRMPTRARTDDPGPAD